MDTSVFVKNFQLKNIFHPYFFSVILKNIILYTPGTVIKFQLFFRAKTNQLWWKDSETMPSTLSASVSQSAVGNQEAVPGDFRWWQCMRSGNMIICHFMNITIRHLGGASIFAKIHSWRHFIEMFFFSLIMAWYPNLFKSLFVFGDPRQFHYFVLS